MLARIERLIYRARFAAAHELLLIDVENAGLGARADAGMKSLTALKAAEAVQPIL